jgi:drug/metabolite transporter (DMT)-like permease
MAKSFSLRKRLDICPAPTHRAALPRARCCSSVVERVIGNDEVGSSILPSSTIPPHVDKRIMASVSGNGAAEPSFLSPRILIPFIIVSLIWGSTWLVIRDQLSVVPASWSVTYRFAIAGIGMFLLSLVMRQSLRLNRTAMAWTLLLGLMQFSLNFNFVYQAEHHITSGLVAVIFALLIIPNALLARWWLGRSIGTPFIIGSIVATTGVAMLMVQEYRAAPVGSTAVLIGIALALLAVLCASVSNVVQVLPGMAKFPTIPVLGWSMLWGTLFNASWAWANFGPPVIDPRPAYLGGVLYLSIVGSVITFPLYFRLIRDIGPGKAAYTSVVIPVVAMLLSTLFEGYRWTPLAMGGAVLVTVGMIIAMRPK